MNNEKEQQIQIIYLQEPHNKKTEDKAILAKKDQTILQISLENHIPHVHACGGNGKCSTCRVIIYKGEENLSPPNEIEIKLSQKKGFGKKIRLACQTKVYGNVTLKRLIQDHIDEEIAITDKNTGREKSIAILFTDIRNFTSFTERHFAYDVVHILNRFYKLMGDAVLNHNGYIDKFMGDGILALFGIDDQDNQIKCNNALSCAQEMKEKLNLLNQYLKQHFNEEFNTGIGIHFGTAIIGDLGHPQKKQITAIGDAVNFTSRLEKLTKKIKTDILLSEEFVKVLNKPDLIDKEYVVQIRGKSGTYKVYTVQSTQKEYVSLRNIIKENLSKTLAPSILRLVFHDVMSGGSITANMEDTHNLSLELQKPVNHNLEMAIKFIQSIKNKVQNEPYSYRDILYLAGATAVEITNGPYIEIIIPSFSDKLFIEIGIPEEHETFNSFYKKFEQLGLSKKEMIALMGAHTLGKENNKPFTNDPFTFDNSYFKRLLHFEEDNTLSSFLKTDWELLQDEDSKQYIQEFAHLEESFFETFKKAYLKMIHFAN